MNLETGMAIKSTGRAHDGHQQRDDRRAPETPPQKDPWSIDGYTAPAPAPRDCACPPTAAPVPQRPEPPETKPKDNDCCQQILDALRCIPGIDERCLRLRKPKTSPKLKITNLCGVLPIKERIVPILMLILRRQRAGHPAGNQFEAAMQAFLSNMAPDQFSALCAALDGYDALPAARRDCVFETRFDAWPDDKPLDAAFFAKNLAGEFVALGRFFRHGPQANIFPGFGGPRPWEQSLPLPGEPGAFRKLTAPWPWICAISPIGHAAIDETGWYKNESSCQPGNLPRNATNIYHTHEFAWKCLPQGSGPLKCDHVEPTSPGSGFGFGSCSGGIDYSTFDKGVGKTVCLAIPQVDPGADVGLRGLNFLTKNAQVRFRKIDQPPFRDIPPQPLSDWQPDQTTPPGVATCSVRDFAYFTMPATVRDGPNDIPVPPGRYAIQLAVHNDLNIPVVPGESPPAEFLSNEILIDLQPSPNQRYQILIDEAGCDEETDGLGSDEPWFRAITGTLAPVMADTALQFPVLGRVEIFSADDVDSGESINFPPASLFNDALGRKFLAIGIIGLEVDSESAARQQIDKFFDAFLDYFNQGLVQIGLATAIGGGGGGALLAAAFKVGSVSASLWIGGAVAAAIVAGAFLYAGWAPADPIAIDSMTLTGRELFDMTDINPGHVPQPSWNRVHQLRMSSESLGKQLAVGGQAAIYSEQRRYVSTWESSRYRLTYRFKRI